MGLDLSFQVEFAAADHSPVDKSLKLGFGGRMESCQLATSSLNVCSANRRSRVLSVENANRSYSSASEAICARACGGRSIRREAPQ